MECSTGDGSSWKTFSDPIFGYVADAIWGNGPADVWITDGASIVHHWNGTGWTHAGLTVGGLSAIWASPSGDAFAIGANGAIMHGYYF